MDKSLKHWYNINMDRSVKLYRDKDWLQEHYIDKNMSVQQIADIFSISKSAVERNLQTHGITKPQALSKALMKKTKLKKYGIDGALYQDKDWLYSIYISENKSVSDVARLAGVQKITIERWLRKYEIKKPQELRCKLVVETNMRKYGVPSSTQSKIVKNKMANTNLKRYGGRSPFSNKKVQAKIKKTLLEKYGHDHPMKVPDIKEKAFEKTRGTNLQKYGHVSSLGNKIVKEKAKKTNIERYGVSNPIHNQDIKDKVRNTNISNNKWFQIDGLETNELEEKFGLSHSYVCKTISNNKDLSDSDILKILEESKSRGFNSLEQTMAKSINLPFFNKMVNLQNIRYKPDFKLNEDVYLNVDGLYWHSEQYRGKNYHFDMRECFEKNGKRLLQFREDEVNTKLPIITSMVNNLLGRNEKIYARKCTIDRVKPKEAREFLEQNHIMGGLKAKSIGLFYQDSLVMVASYKIYKKSVLKIERLCSKLNTSVVGGFSKLLKKLITNSIKEIHYWVDLRYGTGNFLLNCGFEKSHETIGWKWTDLISTYNRRLCRANMDERKLKEREHAVEKGLIRIYDAGQRLYLRKVNV